MGRSNVKRCLQSQHGCPHRKPQQLWLPAQDPDKLKIQSGEAVLRPHPQWGPFGSWRLLWEEVASSWACYHEDLAHTPVVNPTPMCIRALVYVGTILYSMGCVLKEKEKQKRQDGMCWWAEGEFNVLREWLCSRHFIYMYLLVKEYIKYLNIY